MIGSKDTKVLKPRFISRKKRSELNAIKNAIVSESLSLPGPPEGPPAGPPLPAKSSSPSSPEPIEEINFTDTEPQKPIPAASTWTKPLADMTPRDWKIVTSDLGIVYSEPDQHPLRSWKDRNIKSEFKEPTPIQAAAIPLLLDGRNVIGVAPTGSGKTLAFCLPSHRSTLSTLILSPTRELAIQTSTLLAELGVSNACLVGGRDFARQEGELSHASAIVATPGRLIDFVEQGLVSLHTITFFVCDEADRMLDMGFGPQLNQITAGLETPQTALFTATWDDDINNLAKSLAKSAVTIKIGTTINTSIDQHFEWAENKQQRAAQAIRELPKPCIVFCNTKVVCDYLEQVVPSSLALHSSRSQHSREETLARFGRDLDVLIATDVVGRGIDIKGVASVLNYDMPHQVDTYVHRIGRTGRAGRKGRALTFLSTADIPVLTSLKQLLRDAGHSTRSIDSALTKAAG